MKTVIQRFIAGDKKLQGTVDDYIVGVRGELPGPVRVVGGVGFWKEGQTNEAYTSTEMQHKNTVIGDFHSGGLGEVKYHGSFALSILVQRRADLPSLAHSQQRALLR